MCFLEWGCGFVGGMWDVIVLIPDHCLPIYFDCIKSRSLHFIYFYIF